MQTVGWRFCAYRPYAQENMVDLTWCKAALLQNGGCNKHGLLGVCQELVCVPAGLCIACVGVDVAQLPIRGCQLHTKRAVCKYPSRNRFSNVCDTHNGSDAGALAPC